MTEREQFEKWASGQGLNVSEKSLQDLYIYGSTADAWAGWQARATPALPQGEPVVELVWQDEGSDAERELRFIDLCTSFDIPVGTKFYLHPPKPQALPQGVEEWIAENEFPACGGDSKIFTIIRASTLRAYLSGMAIVPVEPTEAMLDAAINACAGKMYPQDMTHGPRAMMRDRFKAMLAAAKEKGE